MKRSEDYPEFVQIRSDVENLLGSDASGHGIDHIDRVYDMAMRFTDSEPDADPRLVGAAALLHEVDDYKLFGRDNADKLPNATAIMVRAVFDRNF